MAGACGVVLAGGRGERLGLGVPKARAVLDGRSLLDRAIATLAAVCAEVIVAAPAGLELGPFGKQAIPVRRIADAAGFEGPLAGLVAGLEGCGETDAAVLGVDFPLVTEAWPRALLERLGAGGAGRAVVVRPGGIPQPLVAAFAAGAAARLRGRLEGGVTSLRGGLESLAITWIDDADLERLPGGIGALLNVNTPADLEAARRALGAVGGGTR